VGDSGDQRGAVHLSATACLGIPDRDDNLAHRHTTSGTHVPGSHQDLVQTGNHQQLLSVAGANGQAVPGIGAVPPRATVVLLQGNDLANVLAQQLGRRDSDDAGGSWVDVDEQPLVVSDQQTVGMVVENCGEPPGGTFGSRVAGPLSHPETLANSRAFLHTSGLV